MKGFISYSHEDHACFGAFQRHLRAIERSYGIEFWADKRITPGDYWSTKIATAIDEASVHILLMSPGFFASNYIYDHELPAIRAKHGSGDLVMPVIASRCQWANFVGVLQAAPMTSAGKPLAISEWKPKDNGHHAACEQLAKGIEAHFGIAPTPLVWTKP